MTDVDRARHLDAIEADLADVELALARLEAGTYETCEVCAGALGDDVLAVTPAAPSLPGLRPLTWSTSARRRGLGYRTMPPHRRRHHMGGTFDEAKGRAKEAAGDLTDDDSLKNEGKVDKAVGKVKEKVDEVADKIKDKL